MFTPAMFQQLQLYREIQQAKYEEEASAMVEIVQPFLELFKEEIFELLLKKGEITTWNDSELTALIFSSKNTTDYHYCYEKVDLSVSNKASRILTQKLGIHILLSSNYNRDYRKEPCDGYVLDITLSVN